jgi:hypothetical protein
LYNQVMKEFFAGRLVRGVLAMFGLTATVGGPAPTGPPAIRAFTSNGCSVFPEGDAFACCYVHDMAYWQGGTASDRRRADLALHQCVASVTGNYVESGLMYGAVSLFGLPGVPTRVRWGYGWGDSRQTRYNPLTPAEQALLDQRKHELCGTYKPARDPDKILVDDRRWIRSIDARRLCPGLGPPAG